MIRLLIFPLILVSFLLIFLSVSGQKKQTTATRENVFAKKNYIPINLDDCLKQLDSMFTDSVKSNIKKMTEDEFTGKHHLGFGMWMRNNWGLWKGSDLSNYFNSLGVYHPDDMTGIIFDSYHRKLTGREIKLSEQIKFYQDYWDKVKKDELERKKLEIADCNIGDTLIFNYNNGFVSRTQENKYDTDECHAKGIITEKEESKFLIKVRLIEGCDPKGIIRYDNKNSLIFNKTTKKLEKPKKRVIMYMKQGEEMWFDYSDWETNN